MLVKECMTRDFTKFNPNSTFKEVVECFQRNRSGIAPIVDHNDTLIGVITVYTVFRSLMNGSTLDDTITGYIIDDIVTVYEEADMIDVRNPLTQNKVAHAIVISKDKRVSGILGKADIFRAYDSKNESLTNSLESLIDHMQTGIIAFDQQGMVLVMNQAATEMCDVLAEACIGKHLSFVFPKLEKILRSKNLSNEHSPIYRITSNNKKLLVTAKSLTNSNHLWGGLFLLQDLTDYEEVAEELETTKKLEKTLQTVVDTAYDALILIDNQGLIQTVNEGINSLYKLSKNQLIHQPIQKFFPDLKLEETISGTVKNEVMEIITINKKQCLVTKIPILQENKIVGAIAKIMYRNLNKWKHVMKNLEDLKKEVTFYQNELSLLSGSSSFSLENIISQNIKISQLKSLANQVASGFSNILLLGESGTGKDLFARGIHVASQRTGRYIKINCAAVPQELWESEFFGYEDGAFTGAKRGGKPGKFELAQNGTLFLDEIGDMPLSMQVKLLRVLQEREFERVGGTTTIRVNVRIVAATNKNLEKMIANGEFREDLYYRLNVIALNIPPLRDRKEDIPLLAESMAKKFGLMMGIDSVSIHSDTIRLLKTHHWPGNIRELENVIERAINCLEGNVINIDHLPDYFTKSNESIDISSSEIIQNYSIKEDIRNNSYKQKVNEAEKEAVQSALQKAGGNRTNAAKILNISRSQLYKKLQKFHLI